MKIRPTFTALALAAAIAVPTAATVAVTSGAEAVSGTPTAAVALAADPAGATGPSGAVAAGAPAVWSDSAASGGASAGGTSPGGTAAGGTAATPTTGTHTPATHARKARRHPLRWLRVRQFRLRGVVHAQWTTKSKSGAFVTHDAIHGAVSDVSTSSGRTEFTVTAADHAAERYLTSSKTEIWSVTKVDGKRRATRTTAKALTKGAEVIVEGTGATGPFAATRILVQLKK